MQSMSEEVGPGHSRGGLDLYEAQLCRFVTCFVFLLYLIGILSLRGHVAFHSFQIHSWPVWIREGGVPSKGETGPGKTREDQPSTYCFALRVFFRGPL